MGYLGELIAAHCILRKALVTAIERGHANETNWWEDRVYKQFKDDRTYAGKITKEKNTNIMDLAMCIKYLLERGIDRNNNLNIFTRNYNLNYHETMTTLNKIKTIRNKYIGHITNQVEEELDLHECISCIQQMYMFTIKFDEVAAKEIKDILNKINNKEEKVQNKIAVKQLAEIANVLPEKMVSIAYKLNYKLTEDDYIIAYGQDILKILEYIDVNGLEEKVTSDVIVDSEIISIENDKELPIQASNQLIKRFSRNDKQAIVQGDLINIIKKYRMFIDTCTLMNEGSEKFIKNTLLPTLRKCNEKIIIPQGVINELLKHINNEQNESEESEVRKYLEETRRKAIRGFKLVKLLYKQGACVVRGEAGDSTHVDRVFLYVFEKFMDRYNVCLITQDRNLAKDCWDKTKRMSLDYQKELTVLRITKNGNVFVNDGGAISSNINENTSHVDIKQEFNKYVEESRQPLYSLGIKPEPIDDVSILKGKIPSSGDVIPTESGQNISLGEEISAGGEGVIYKTNQLGKVAKVYFKERTTKQRYDKIKLMISKPVHIQEVCWPEDIILNEEGEFVGYIMAEAKGETLFKALRVPAMIAKYYPQWTRKHLVILAMTILDVFEKLHRDNIIVGDINALNILVEDEKTVYFVDSDSYQIENYPCVVGTPTFTAPEIFKVFNEKGITLDYKTFLRTFEHEQFALMTLVFQILVPSKGPYECQNGGTIEKNIIAKNFAYPFDERKADEAPAGPWRYIWSHMPYSIKVMFDEAFARDKRYSETYIKKKLREYVNLIEKGNISDEMFPKTFKETSNTVFKTLVCPDCHKEFNIDEDTYNKRMILGKSGDVSCQICRQAIAAAKQELYEYECRDCGDTYALSRLDIAGYMDKGYQLPTRCQTCRSQKKRYDGTINPDKKREWEARIYGKSQKNKHVGLPTVGNVKTQAAATSMSSMKPSSRLRKLFRNKLVWIGVLIVVMSMSYIGEQGFIAYVEVIRSLVVLIIDLVISLAQLFINLIGKLIEFIQQINSNMKG